MVSANLAVGFAAGALLHLLLVMLVAARPAPRRLDRLFLFLFGALFLWHAGNLLALTLSPFQGIHQAALVAFARAAAFTGLAALSPLLAHVHIEYSRAAWQRAVWLFYLPLAAAPWGIRAAAAAPGIPRGFWTTGFILYFSAALLFAVVANFGLARRTAGHLRFLHGALAVFFGSLAAACLWVFLIARGAPALDWLGYLLMLSSMVPSALVGYWMFRFNFLEARAQQNVALAMLGILGLLAYALVIQRLGQALERRGYLPATVTGAVLVFFLVVLVEPVSRLVRRWMTRQVSAELARLDALRAELHHHSAAAPPEEVRAFAEERLAAFFGFPVRLEVDAPGVLHPQAGRDLTLRELGALRVLAAHTAEAMERSRLLAELAERRKMAALGEMVAFLAHRLKNPLSAINTLVQVIAEQSPQAAQHCEVIRGEIRRLNAAVGDLLRFTRPAGPAPAAEPISAQEALQAAVGLFSAEAQKKGITLECRCDPSARLRVRREALDDILSSLLENALEAAPADSRLLLSCENGARGMLLSVEDAGPGVAPEHAEKIFQPFFTLKPGGTGLGLALARRRAQEAGGEIRCVSPARDGRGARFEVSFPTSES